MNQNRDVSAFYQDYPEVWKKIEWDLRSVISKMPEESVEDFWHRLTEILEIPSRPHNYVSPSIESYTTEHWENGLRVRSGEKIIQWDVVAMFWWKVYSLEDYFLLDPEVQKWHIAVWEWFTIWAWSRFEVDDGDFVNHSCDPNCEIVWQIELRAIRDIEAWEEPCFDYSTVLKKINIDANKATIPEGFISHNETSEFLAFPWECECGSEKCRKIITSE